MIGDLITYTLVTTNSAPIAASYLVITDALPTGANFIKASNNGLRVGNLVSWTVPSLGPGDSLIRTFTITAAETITNAYYRVSSVEGVSAEGQVAVVTKVKRVHGVYLPIVVRKR